MMKKIDDFLKKKKKYKVDVIIEHFEEPVVRTFLDVNVILNRNNIEISGISKVDLNKNIYTIEINEHFIMLRNQYINNQLIIR